MATEYRLERSLTSYIGPWEDVGEIIDTPVVREDEEPASIQWWRVLKYVDSILTETSNTVRTVTLDTPFLWAEGGVEVEYIRLWWMPTCASKYNIYRWNHEVGNKTFLGMVEDVNEYFDYAIGYDQLYCYIINALTDNEQAESADSNIACAIVTRGGVFSTMLRATALQGIQYAPEVARGVILPTTRRLLNMQLTPSAEIPVKEVKYPGTLVATDTQVSQEHTTAPFEGAMDFNLIAVLLTTMLGAPTITTVGTNGRKRAWTPSPVVPVTPVTLTIESGSSAGSEKFGAAFVNEIEMSWGKEAADISGTILGQKLVRNAVITPSGVTTIAPMAIDPLNIGCFISSDNGATYVKLLDLLEGSVRIRNLTDVVFHVNDSINTWDDIVTVMPDMGFELTVDEGTEADVFANALRSSTLLWIGLQAVGPVIDAGSSAIADPTVAPTLSTATTGGSLVPGTYVVAYSWKNASGETKVSPRATIVVPAGTSTNTITVTAPTLPAGATGINTYMGTNDTDIAFNATESDNEEIVTTANPAGAAAPSSVNTTATGLSYHLLRLNMPVRVLSEDPGDKNDVWGNTFNLGVAYESVSMDMLQLEVTTALTSIG